MKAPVIEVGGRVGRVMGEGFRMEQQPSKYERIYHVVSLIPPGRVATYGQVAALAGLPGRARLVGHALSASNDRMLPWHRVVNASGGISIRAGAISSDTVQRLRLENEGVEFDEHGRLSLERYRWRPDVGTPSPSGEGRG